MGKKGHAKALDALGAAAETTAATPCAIRHDAALNICSICCKAYDLSVEVVMRLDCRACGKDMYHQSCFLSYVKHCFTNKGDWRHSIFDCPKSKLLVKPCRGKIVIATEVAPVNEAKKAKRINEAIARAPAERAAKIAAAKAQPVMVAEKKKKFTNLLPPPQHVKPKPAPRDIAATHAAAAVPAADAGPREIPGLEYEEKAGKAKARAQKKVAEAQATAAKEAAEAEQPWSEAWQGAGGSGVKPTNLDAPNKEGQGKRFVTTVDWYNRLLAGEVPSSEDEEEDDGAGDCENVAGFANREGYGQPHDDATNQPLPNGKQLDAPEQAWRFDDAPWLVGLPEEVEKSEAVPVQPMQEVVACEFLELEGLDIARWSQWSPRQQELWLRRQQAQWDAEDAAERRKQEEADALAARALAASAAQQEAAAAEAAEAAAAPPRQPPLPPPPQLPLHIVQQQLFGAVNGGAPHVAVPVPAEQIQAYMHAAGALAVTVPTSAVVPSAAAVQAVMVPAVGVTQPLNLATYQLLNLSAVTRVQASGPNSDLHAAAEVKHDNEEEEEESEDIDSLMALFAT